MFKGFLNKFSSDIGLDLGTANTRICLGDKGVVINEPSVVAVNNKTDRMVAYGLEARTCLARLQLI
jgi:rod shape-determining protein MreB